MGDLTLSDIFRSGELGFGGSIRNEKDGGGMGISVGLLKIKKIGSNDKMSSEKETNVNFSYS